MGRPIYVKLTLAAASVNKIALSQSLVGAGNFTLNGAAATAGVATLDAPRRVLFTDGADNSAAQYTITGTGWFNGTIAETVQGTNSSTVYSTQDFLTITNIASSAAATSVQIGTNAVGSSRPVNMDDYGLQSVSVQLDISGTGTFTVEATLHEVLDVLNAPFQNQTGVNQSGSSSFSPFSFPQWWPLTGFNAVTAGGFGGYQLKPKYIRLTNNAGTATGLLSIVQAGQGIS